jgi:hypothetical protein
MDRKITLLLLTGSLLAVQARPDELQYESKKLGLRFKVPQSFLAGVPAPLPGSKERAEAMARRGLEYNPPNEESLIDRKWAKGQDLKALRRDLLQITLDRQRGSDAEFSRETFMKDRFRQRIGPWEAYASRASPDPMAITPSISSSPSRTDRSSKSSRPKPMRRTSRPATTR